MDLGQSGEWSYQELLMDWKLGQEKESIRKIIRGDDNVMK